MKCKKLIYRSSLIPSFRSSNTNFQIFMLAREKVAAWISALCLFSVTASLPMR